MELYNNNNTINDDVIKEALSKLEVYTSAKHTAPVYADKASQHLASVTLNGYMPLNTVWTPATILTAEVDKSEDGVAKLVVDAVASIGGEPYAATLIVKTVKEEDFDREIKDYRLVELANLDGGCVKQLKGQVSTLRRTVLKPIQQSFYNGTFADDKVAAIIKKANRAFATYVEAVGLPDVSDLPYGQKNVVLTKALSEYIEAFVYDQTDRYEYLVGLMEKVAEVVPGKVVHLAHDDYDGTYFVSMKALHSK